jgi:hypothetical protein
MAEVNKDDPRIVDAYNAIAQLEQQKADIKAQILSKLPLLYRLLTRQVLSNKV